MSNVRPFGHARCRRLTRASRLAGAMAKEHSGKAVYDLAIELKEKGPMAEAEFTKKLSNHPLADFHGFAGFDQVMEWEERFMGEAELAKYEGTLGHQPKAAE